MTKCVRCEGQAFRVQEISPSGAAHRMYAIQCASFACQAAIGVTDFWNLGSLLKSQEKKIEEMENKLSSIQSSVSQIVQALSSRGR
jgi:predicted transcriptional regulator